MGLIVPDVEAIKLLKRDALLRHNAKILAAKRDYYKELKAIKTLGRSLGVFVYRKI